MPTNTSLLPPTVGVVLARLVVPLWVLTGALFKTFHATPKNLPPTILKSAHSIGIDLFLLLWVLVAIELVAVGVMFFVPRLARATAILMSSVFCLVLLAELVTGNFTSCGCLGDITIPPWAMLLIDGAMLAGLLLSGPTRVSETPPRMAPRAALTGVWSIAWLVVSGVIVLGAGRPAPPPVQPDEGDETPPPPPAYYVADCDTWADRPFAELELARYVTDWPADLGSGKRYVIFFSRSCDHCVELLDLHFAMSPPAPTTIVAIPETKDAFEPAAALPYDCVDCEELELPLGVDWIITPPIVVALEDGIVRCAIETEDGMAPECLIWHQQ